MHVGLISPVLHGPGTGVIFTEAFQTSRASTVCHLSLFGPSQDRFAWMVRLFVHVLSSGLAFDVDFWTPGHVLCSKICLEILAFTGSFIYE